MAGLVSVFRYIERWGVPVVSAGPVTHAAPYGYTGGIHWPTRTIVTPLIAQQVETGRREWAWDGALLVHELSHVLVDENPDGVDEVESAMLALDYAGCRLLKLGWSEWMSEYEVAGRHWSLMSRQARADALAISRREARERGLLDERGRPTFRRLDEHPRAAGV